MSPKRSGGGECQIHVEPGEKERVVVCFAKEEARQGVLRMKTHELDLPPKKKLKLTVSLPPVAASTVENEPMGELNPSQESIVAEEPKEPEWPEDVAEKLANQEEFCVVIVTPIGEEVDEDIVEMYFENKKRSGGGPIKSCVKDGKQLIITFESKEDAEEVLQRNNHVLRKTALQVRQPQKEAAQASSQVSASLIVLENLQDAAEECMLILLVENVSGLSEEDKEFTVEMIPESNTAVITFIKPIEIDEFIEKFNQYHMVKQLNISAHSLEVTKSILVENIPPGISRDFIFVYFECKKNGGGLVLDVNYLPEENSAMITFQDGKDVTTILKRKHSLNNVPVLVYPYYVSLGAALYGKEKPQIKMPDLSRLPIDLYRWQFLQQNPQLLQEISREMAGCYCEIEWPDRYCTHPEITVHPSCALSKQKRSLVKTWSENVSTQLTQILSRQKIAKCVVNAEVWEAIRNSIVKDDILILPDIPKGIVVLVGAAEAVDHSQQEMKMLIEKAAEKIEREKQTIEETVSVVAGKYTILNNAELQNSIYLEYPDLKIAYDASKECIILHGVTNEVFKIKSAILERVSSIDQKSVDIHPYIFLFLQYVDNECLSQFLFWAKKINAFYELKDEAVLLTGADLQDLQRAEEEMKKELVFKCIELEDNSILRKREWRELTNSFYKADNCLSEAIIIHELENQIVIAGWSREVALANEKLSSFIDSNTYIQKTIRTKSTAVTMYVEKEKHNSWLNLEQQGMKINFGTRANRRLISLEGPKVKVLKGLELFQNILSSLYATSMTIDKPGAKALFKEQEHLYVAGAKQQFNCLIRIQEGMEDVEQGSDESGPEEKRLPCCEIKLKDGVVVAVHKGDLTRYPVDVVVNASNEELKHIGGLADALLKAAGPQLQSECDDLVRKHGRLKPGCAIITGAWNLPCKQVIHAVGPRWSSSEKEKCIQLLKKAVRDSLHLAEVYNHRSIAIPAISSGIFGFPLKECARSIVTSIKETLEESPETGCLKEICLVDAKEDTVRALSEALNEISIDKSLPSKWSSASKTKNHTTNEHQGVTTPEGLKIVLQKEGIEDATTDIIVNSVARDLQLDKGPLSKALLARAGEELQDELTKEGQGKDIKEGCVLKTSGYALGCSYVLHANLPNWNQDKKSQILGNIVEECLKITEQLSLNSITIPAIGTGNLRFPKQFVAKVMFDEVFKFSKTENLRFLQEVHFVLHPSDTGTIKAFTDELNARLNLTQTSSSVSESSQQLGQVSFVHISSPASGVHKMQIGPITLQVESGDIAQEITDVIVNITNDTFNLKVGVSKAILESAGPEMEKECAQLATQPHNNLVCTQAGNLKCKNIIHLVAQNDTKAQVSKALLECEQRKFSSIAFPAIGTGQAGRDPVVVADDMIDAIVDFVSQTSDPVVKNIKIIIFQPHLLSVFFASMQRKEVSASKHSGTHSSKSFLSKVADFFTSFKKPEEVKPVLLLERTVEPTIFQICGESWKNVERTESWIRNLILKDQTETVVSDEWISNFGESEYETLRDLQIKLHVVIKLEHVGASPSLHVFGITKDVLRASAEIQKMIRKVREGREEQSKADLLSNIVEWRYEDNGKYKAFDNLTNMHLESAAQHQKPHEITIKKKQYRVDPSKLCAVDDLGTSITLRRISKVEDNLAMALPEQWEDMEQTRVKIVALQSEMEEYINVKTMFCLTCKSFTIEKIERIQNPYYWQAYQIKKQEMDDKNGNTNNERQLFHGTASASLTLINNSGFNRSYAGMHAAAYGNGTYFAVDAKYSAHDIYSKPDANGTKYMYLARVLVGEYCAGSAGLVVPKPKNATDPTDLFDSVTDNVTKPAMFVIFNDIQAYPEYLITFKK
ncbi:protein mono-ADP-ribosyltransferase PARP14-like isoform X2 [Rhineura floridana]|uniref:protein mono-ADP-ribosyltransferase PARP14-like isoform X2 n=1 Tax=Rhineura floridana TaxID=261503 RepID=UPI002AC836AE|nr:protein mono-ADP-ribosyltransferase PARP14-like isoform X2 [Rhineura floridana]